MAALGASNIMQTCLTLNKKSFRAIDNNSGISSSETVFTYSQNGNLITGEYKGGEIEHGNIVGEFVPPNTIKLLFQCRTTSNELLSGKSEGVLKNNHNGKISIAFKWTWVSGTEGSGNSYHEEI